MTNNEHIERLESLAAELDKAIAFLDPPTPGETYWQELDAVLFRAGAAALRKIEVAKLALRPFAERELIDWKDFDNAAAALAELEGK